MAWTPSRQSLSPLDLPASAALGPADVRGSPFLTERPPSTETGGQTQVHARSGPPEV